ncbi:hypothetical protein E6O75_ATG00046 [Venturia nashicola]|uniref:Uncharacterized protein n=1 Tax=Venturia nashicola TaxID=86259 RepID=A0A4Z1PM97_9PEZI|nr:hypothetical protein E6O75_ATG00046 [Venturia nashicola]
MRFLVVSLLVASSVARSGLRIRELGGLDLTESIKDIVSAGNIKDLSNTEIFENIENSENVSNYDGLESVDNAERAEAVEDGDTGPPNKGGGGGGQRPQQTKPQQPRPQDGQQNKPPPQQPKSQPRPPQQQPRPQHQEQTKPPPQQQPRPQYQEQPKAHPQQQQQPKPQHQEQTKLPPQQQPRPQYQEQPKAHPPQQQQPKPQHQEQAEPKSHHNDPKPQPRPQQPPQGNNNGGRPGEGSKPPQGGNNSGRPDGRGKDKKPPNWNNAGQTGGDSKPLSWNNGRKSGGSRDNKPPNWTNGARPGDTRPDKKPKDHPDPKPENRPDPRYNSGKPWDNKIGESRPWDYNKPGEKRPNNGDQRGEFRPQDWNGGNRGGDNRPGSVNNNGWKDYKPRPDDKHPDWNNGKGSDWGRGINWGGNNNNGGYYGYGFDDWMRGQPWGWNQYGNDGGWRDGKHPQYVTIQSDPLWDWNRPGYYEPYFVTFNLPKPTWADIPFIPVVTVEAPPPVAPFTPYDPGCRTVETTIHIDTTTEATFTSTITDAPEGTVTVYQDKDGQEYTYGASTIYEVYIYTTTQSIDLVGIGLDCPFSASPDTYGASPDDSWVPLPEDSAASWLPAGVPIASDPNIWKKQEFAVEPNRKMRRTPRTMAARALPAYVEARATPA